METASKTKQRFIVIFLWLVGFSITAALTFMKKIDVQTLSPMEFMSMFGGVLLPIKPAIFLSLILTLSTSLVLKTPPIIYGGILLTANCITAALVSSVLYRKIKLHPILTLLIAELSAKLMLCLTAFVATLFFSFGENPLRYTLDVFVKGLPGFLIQLVMIPLMVYGIKKYTTLDL